MIKKIKKIHGQYVDRLERIESQNCELISLNKELLWSQVYHDSIRGYSCLQHLSLNVGRWAGNYAFFYYLLRILADARPKSILELGLGESTKFISSFIESELAECSHEVVEHDETWETNFNKSFALGGKTAVKHRKLQEVDFRGEKVTSYMSQLSDINALFELYVVDGPFGSPVYSRIDILTLIDKFPKNHEFIILFDDTHRKGEQTTLALLTEKLKSKGFATAQAHAQGSKRVSIITTPTFKWLTSI